MLNPREYNCGGVIWFPIVATALLTIQIIAFGKICELSASRPQILYLNSVLDAIFLLMPYIFLPPKWRRTLWIIEIAITCLFITEIIHYRNFGIFYSGAAIFSSNIFDPIVLKSSAALIKTSDLWIIAPPFLLIPFYIMWRKDILSYRYKKSIRIFSAVLMAAIPFILFGTATRRAKAWYPEEAPTYTEAFKFECDRLASPPFISYIAEDLGITFLTAKLLTDLIPDTYTLSDSERKEIEQLLHSKSAQNNAQPANKGKNLILIIVESLNSTVFDIPDRASIIPVLGSLAHDNSTLFAPFITTQCGPGGSCDGQLMYNTGLLPLKDKPFPAYFADSDYPSLAKALNGYTSIEVIGENPKIWNHMVTSKSYGYTNLIHSLAEKGDNGIDGNIFNGAIAALDTIHQPFFMEITTLAMHSPYTEPKTSPKLGKNNPTVNSLEPRDRNYIEATHEFDIQLGKFLSTLKRKNLYGNTIIAITGDHHAPHASLSDKLNTIFVPLIILNSGTHLKYKETAGQIDIFPTLLDIMGIESYVIPMNVKEYRGLGQSLIGNTPPVCAMSATGKVYREGKEHQNSEAYTDLEQSWKTGQLIIRSRYFNR